MNSPEMHLERPQATEKPCEECGTVFTAKRRWARFCGTPCRNEWHRKKALGPDGRLAEIERRLADLERRVTVLDDPLAR